MKQYLTMGAAVTALEDLASDQDEIEFAGNMTTPEDLLDGLSEETETKGVTIGFTKLDGDWVGAGTLADMVADRLKGDQ